MQEGGGAPAQVERLRHLGGEELTHPGELRLGRPARPARARGARRRIGVVGAAARPAAGSAPPRRRRPSPAAAAAAANSAATCSRDNSPTGSPGSSTGWSSDQSISTPSTVEEPEIRGTPPRYARGYDKSVADGRAPPTVELRGPTQPPRNHAVPAIDGIHQINVPPGSPPLREIIAATNRGAGPVSAVGRPHPEWICCRACCSSMRCCAHHLGDLLWREAEPRITSRVPRSAPLAATQNNACSELRSREYG